MEDKFGLVLTSVLGIVLALTWLLLLKSYRDLNGAKFKVIHELGRISLSPSSSGSGKS